MLLCTMQKGLDWGCPAPCRLALLDQLRRPGSLLSAIATLFVVNMEIGKSDKQNLSTIYAKDKLFDLKS